MKIAITGGTGFIGGHLARDLAQRGHVVVIISRGQYSRPGAAAPANATTVKLSTTDEPGLERAFAGCDAVAHCAGTSAPDAAQSFEQVHVEGTRAAVRAAESAGVKKFVLVSYLNVRAGTNSQYLGTKWDGEEIVRASKLNYTIFKAGLIYGAGDHLLTNLGGLLRRMPVFGTVGIKERTVRLIAVEDLIAILTTALLDQNLFARQTISVMGPEEFPFSTAARRIAQALGRPFLIVLPFPVFFQRMLAWGSENFMSKPLITASQVQMLADGISEPQPGTLALPAELTPKIRFTEDQIREGLPKA